MKKWLAIHIPVFIAIIGVVIYGVFFAAGIWAKLDAGKDGELKEMHRLKSDAVVRGRQLIGDLEASRVMSEERARELGLANKKLDTALSLNAYYRGLIAEGTATPENPVPPDAPYAKFNFDDQKRYHGFFEYPSGAYGIYPYPLPLTFTAVRDTKGNWTASFDAEKLAAYLDIPQAEAEELFYIEDFRPLETKRETRWYEKLFIDGGVGYDGGVAFMGGIGYDRFRADLKVDTNGKTGFYAAASWSPFAQIP